MAALAPKRRTPGGGEFSAGQSDSIVVMLIDARRPQLVDVNASDRLGQYLHEMWVRRGYVWYVAANELRSRQVTTVLGNLWHLLNPALTIGVYYVVFGLILSIDRGVDNFILFLAVGLFMFQYTQRATIAGGTAITANTGLLKAIRFPRALLPTASTATETLATVPTIGVVFIVAILTGEPLSLRWVVLPAVLAVQFVFNLGAAMITARLTTHFRDTTQLLPFVFRLLLYASGVIFSVDEYISSGSPARWLFVLNPVYCFVQAGRWCVMGERISQATVVSGLVWSGSIAVAGFIWFRAGERRYARD